MTWCAVPLTIRLWPIADGSPLNARCQYRCVIRTTSALFGRSSSFVMPRPSAGRMPSIGSVPSVTLNVSTCSGSPRPVIVADPFCHSPMSWNDWPLSRIMKYVPADCCSGPCITPGATSHAPTRADGSAYGSGLRITPLTTLKIRALAPMAAPTVMMAVRAKTGLLSKRRSECFTLRETESRRREVRIN